MSDEGQGRVNLERLASEITEHVQPPTAFIPRARRNIPALPHVADAAPSNIYPTTDSPYRPGLEIIALAITRLTWKQAEEMGQAVQMKMKEGGSLTAAIQAWAEEEGKSSE